MTMNIAEDWLLAPLPTTTTRKENRPPHPPPAPIQKNQKKNKKNPVQVRGRQQQSPATESRNQKQKLEDPSAKCMRMPDVYATQVIHNAYGPNCNLYEIFNVQTSASTAQIRSAYFQLGRQTMLLHRHHSTDPQTKLLKKSSSYFHAITKAFEILAHADTRAYYDTYGLIQQQEQDGSNAQSTCMNVHSKKQPQLPTKEVREFDEAETTISVVTYNTSGNASSIAAATTQSSVTSSILKRSKSWGPSSRSNRHSKNNHDDDERNCKRSTPRRQRSSSSSKPRKIWWNEHVEELVYTLPMNTSIDTSYTTTSSASSSACSSDTSPNTRNSTSWSQTSTITTSIHPDQDNQGNETDGSETRDAKYNNKKKNNNMKKQKQHRSHNDVPDAGFDEITTLQQLEQEQNGTDILDGLEASLEQLGNTILHGFRTSTTTTNNNDNNNNETTTQRISSSMMVPPDPISSRTNHNHNNNIDGRNDSEPDTTPLVVFTERIVLPYTEDHSSHPRMDTTTDRRKHRPTGKKSYNAMEDNVPQHQHPSTALSFPDPFSTAASFVHVEHSRGGAMYLPNTITAKSAIPAFDPFSTDELSQDAQNSFVSIAWTEEPIPIKNQSDETPTKDPIPIENQSDETPTKQENTKQLNRSDHCTPVRQTMSFDDAFLKKRQSSVLTIDDSSTVDQKRPVDTVITRETLNASGITFLTHNTPEKTQPLSVEIEKAWNEFAKQAQETITVAQQSVENSVRALSPVFGAPSSSELSTQQHAAVVTPSEEGEDANAWKRSRNAAGVINNTQESTTTFLDSLNSCAQCIMDNMNLLGLQFNSTMEIANKELTSKWKEANQGISSTIGEANKVVRNTLVLPEDEMDGMLEVLGIEMNLSLDAMDTSHDSLQKSFTF
jgi:curved DNA-binding protein CbpA